MIASLPGNFELTGKYSNKQVCALLDISLRTLYRLRQRRQLRPSIDKFNNRPYYPGREIKRFFEHR